MIYVCKHICIYMYIYIYIYIYVYTHTHTKITTITKIPKVLKSSEYFYNNTNNLLLMMIMIFLYFSPSVPTSPGPYRPANGQPTASQRPSKFNFTTKTTTILILYIYI